MVQLGLTFEKSEEQGRDCTAIKSQTKRLIYSYLVDYRRIQNTCADFINGIEPNCDDIPELDAYFTLSEYYAYASRKVRMIFPLLLFIHSFLSMIGKKLLWRILCIQVHDASYSKFIIHHRSVQVLSWRIWCYSQTCPCIYTIGQNDHIPFT